MDGEKKELNDLSNSKGLKLVHLNVRSLPKKIDQLRLLLHGVCVDALTISQSWLKGALSTKLFDIDGYKLFRLDRGNCEANKKKGGGLVTYVSEKHAPLSSTMVNLNISTRHLEAQWVKIERPKCRDIVIGNMYRPPSGNLNLAIEYMDETLKSLNLQKMDVFLMGDLNVNFKNKKSADFKKINFLFKSNGLSQLIKQTTRNTDKTKSLLDVIATNSKYISEAGTLDHFISDHQPIYVIKKKKRDSRPKVEFRGRSYRNYNGEDYKRNLLECDWGNFYKLEDPNEAWEYMLNQFTPLIDKMCPIRDYTIKNYEPDWVTSELLEQIKDRDYFFCKARETNDPDAWNIARHLRNVTNANIRSAKRDFILDELENNKHDYKKFWKNICAVMPDNKESSRQEIRLKDNGLMVARNGVAHYINDYFINVGKPDSEHVEEVTGQQYINDYLDVCHFEDFTEAEVYKALKEINVSKSSGMDNISSFVIKETFLTLLTQITHLYNLSAKCSVFPQAWKDALVIPIPKTGDLSNVKNFRPISLLPLPGKILEKLVKSQVTKHFENNNIFSEVQHGFRKNHSTIHSVAQLANYVNVKMDAGTPTLATFIDFRKAFDCVQHSTLLDKLKNSGLSKGITDWIASYLSEWRHRVLANNTVCDYQTVLQGVPQGSVLRPQLYIIYANDIVKKLNGCYVVQYADDTVLYTANANFTRSVSKMQHDLTKLSDWCKMNGIMANTSKTKMMLFGSKTAIDKIPEFEISIDNVPLQLVNSYKYLGITMDGQLRYDSHFHKLVNNVSGKLTQFRRMRSFLNDKAAMLVYKNMLLPILEYGDILFTGVTMQQKKRLQILQNKGLRCALNEDRSTSTLDLHNQARLLKLNHRREQHLLNFMFDVARDKSNLKPKNETGVVTRSSSKTLLKCKRPRTERFKKCLAYLGPKRWNALPGEYHNTDSKNAFNNLIAKLMEKKVSREVLSESVLEC